MQPAAANIFVVPVGALDHRPNTAWPLKPAMTRAVLVDQLDDQHFAVLVDPFVEIHGNLLQFFINNRQQSLGVFCVLLDYIR